MQDVSGMEVIAVGVALAEENRLKKENGAMVVCSMKEKVCVKLSVWYVCVDVLGGCNSFAQTGCGWKVVHCCTLRL